MKETSSGKFKDNPHKLVKMVCADSILRRFPAPTSGLQSRGREPSSTGLELGDGGDDGVGTANPPAAARSPEVGPGVCNLTDSPCSRRPTDHGQGAAAY